MSIIRRLRAHDGRSWRAISDDLNDRGYRTRSGGSWFPNTVRRIFFYGNRPFDKSP